NDGTPDLATANYQSGSVSVLLATPTARFSRLGPPPPASVRLPWPSATSTKTASSTSRRTPTVGATTATSVSRSPRATARSGRPLTSLLGPGTCPPSPPAT